MAKNVQFRGIGNTLKAFQARNVDAWSLWVINGSIAQFLNKGVGEDDLAMFLSMIEISSAVYTLKVYEGITDASQIKERTECDGSFNFSLIDAEEDFGRYTDKNRANRLFERISALEAKQNQEIEEEEPGIGKVINSWLENPGELLDVIEKAKRVFGFAQVVQPFQTPQQEMIGNVVGTDNLEKKIERLQAAVNILEKNDPKIIEHLEKLADMSQNNPGQFQFLISALESMK